MFIDVLKENMHVVGITEEDAGHRVRWRRVISCGDPPNRSSRKMEKGKLFSLFHINVTM